MFCIHSDHALEVFLVNLARGDMELKKRQISKMSQNYQKKAANLSNTSVVIGNVKIAENKIKSVSWY